MSFLDLPNEVIPLISRKQSLCELNSLLRVSRFLVALLTPALLDCAPWSSQPIGKRALYSAAKYRDNARVQHLLSRGILDFVGNGALLHVRTVTLLQCGIDPVAQNLQSQTALFSAGSYGRVENVRVLLDDDRVDVNLEDTNGCRPLREAVGRGRGSVVQFLLDRGANISSNPRHTPLLALAIESQS